MIISVLNQKGGVGKTTLATHISVALSATEKLLLVDADMQQSALDWGAKREGTLPFTLMGLAKPVLHRDIPPLLGNPYTTIVIDGPGKLTEIPRSAILASDIVLIPIQPSPYDIWASHEIIGIINEARIFKPDVRAAFVITRARANTKSGRDVVEALAEYDFPCFETQIYQRECYTKTAGRGLTVIEIKPTEDSEKQAAEETRAFIAELMKFAGRHV